MLPALPHQLPEPILHQHHVRGGVSIPQIFQPLLHSEVAGTWQMRRARSHLAGSTCAPMGARGWQGVRERPLLLENQCFSRAEARSAQGAWLQGVLCLQPPGPPVPPCSSPLSLCQRQLKAQQQRGPPSQELTALKTENGEKKMCVSLSPLLCFLSVILRK